MPEYQADIIFLHFYTAIKARMSGSDFVLQEYKLLKNEPYILHKIIG